MSDTYVCESGTVTVSDPFEVGAYEFRKAVVRLVADDEAGDVAILLLDVEDVDALISLLQQAREGVR